MQVIFRNYYYLSKRKQNKNNAGFSLVNDVEKALSELYSILN